MVAGAAIALAAVFAWRSRAPDHALVVEAVNDHLRVLYSDHPLEVESGGIHRVKPWFAGRLDFAPVIDFAGDDDFPLQGGSVGYFIDRKAATFVFKRRLHEITLFIFRADGLHWPGMGLRPIGPARGIVETSRGFHVALWRQGDLGYALVSDVNEADLVALAAKIAGPTSE
jgi:anti-sigma factor RsiW